MFTDTSTDVHLIWNNQSWTNIKKQHLETQISDLETQVLSLCYMLFHNKVLDVSTYEHFPATDGSLVLCCLHRPVHLPSFLLRTRWSLILCFFCDCKPAFTPSVSCTTARTFPGEVLLHNCRLALELYSCVFLTMTSLHFFRTTLKGLRQKLLDSLLDFSALRSNLSRTLIDLEAAITFATCSQSLSTSLTICLYLSRADVTPNWSHL